MARNRAKAGASGGWPPAGERSAGVERPERVESVSRSTKDSDTKLEWSNMLAMLSLRGACAGDLRVSRRRASIFTDASSQPNKELRFFVWQQASSVCLDGLYPLAVQSMNATQLAFDFPRLPADDFLKEIEGFSLNGKRTLTEYWGNVPYFFNEFWTAKQRDAHPLHEVSYRACFKPQLPAFFIERLTKPGDKVYDPFMGRGTTPIQAALMGRYPVANDVNPLSRMLCRPRLNTPTLREIDARLAGLDLVADIQGHEDLLAFYHPDTLAEIIGLRRYLIQKDQSGQLDAIDDWIRMVAINRLTGHSPGFFSVYSLPPNQAVTVDRQLRINEQRNQVPSKRDIRKLIAKKSQSLLKEGGICVASDLHVGRSEQTPKIKDASISLVVTSPPFLDIVQYASDNWLRCWFAGINAQEVDITIHRNVKGWQEFTHATLRELTRVVRPRGYIAYEVGEVRGGKIELDRVVLDAAEGLPLGPVAVLINDQEFTKTANCWGVSNNKSGTNTNRIVILERLDG